MTEPLVKSCPFCGEKPEIRDSNSVCKCRTMLCPASMGWSLIDAWNDRKQQEPPQ